MSSKKCMIVSFIFIISLFCTCLFSCLSKCTSSPKMSFKEENKIINKHRYENFIRNWNRFAEKISSCYIFIGDNIANESVFQSTLKKWCAAFMSKKSEKYMKDLFRLADEIPESTFFAYENFRKKHYQDSPLVLYPGMTEQEISSAVNAYIGVTTSGAVPDYVTAETVKTILYMNNFCIFFREEKEYLHQQGIDININFCKELTSGGKYPALDALLD